MPTPMRHVQKATVPAFSKPGLALALCAGVLCSSVAAQTLNLEDRLAAIRSSLVQAALEEPTQVQSTQWIDAKGVLQESSTFRNGMKIRGVRVLAYGTDAQGQPNAKLELQNKSALEKQACSVAAASTLQHVVSFTMDAGGPWSADDAPLVDALRTALNAEWQRASVASALWRLSDRSYEDSRSAYQQALLGNSGDDIPLKIQISIFMAQKKDKQSVVQMRMTLTARNQSKPLAQSILPMVLDSKNSNWGAPQLSDDAIALLSQQVKATAQTVQSALACKPVQAEVTQAMGTQVRINMGSAAGVKIGDEWLLADGQKFPQRVLEAGVASQTVLARVQLVGEHFAQLKPVAGPMQSVQRQWSAWSADGPR